ncbi:MAG: DUF3179 domain-containing protein, partial [Boseongicola sp.]
MPTRRNITAMIAATILAPTPALAELEDPYKLQRDIVFGGSDDFNAALNAMKIRGNPDMAAGLITGMRYVQGAQDAISDVLTAITGETRARTWFDWMLWQERNANVIPHPSYAEFKREIFLRIDPNFDVFLRAENTRPEAMRIRLEEITWGGVPKDGIPSLDNPELIPAAEAEFMREGDLVFGVSINGDTRAYPLRIMGWHEMFNEVIGGVPVALAYCTLCGSGILFETEVPELTEPLIFGSSGFLYRSNKLMFDRATHSLWNQFTGRPVSGELVDSGVELAQRPVVIDTWANWREVNPETRILSLNTGHRRDYGPGVVYRGYFASDKLMFPTNVDQSLHQQKDYVFGVRQFGGAKAWPINAFADEPVINDGLLDRPLVLIGSPDTRTVRAYERGTLQFSGDINHVLSDDGALWRITEDSLIADDGRT